MGLAYIMHDVQSPVMFSTLGEQAWTCAFERWETERHRDTFVAGFLGTISFCWLEDLEEPQGQNYLRISAGRQGYGDTRRRCSFCSVKGQCPARRYRSLLSSALRVGRQAPRRQWQGPNSSILTSASQHQKLFCNLQLSTRPQRQ